MKLFHDRHAAGAHLARSLSLWVERDDVIILALPRGGVPVAFEVAHYLNAPLDLMLVRKLGVPGHEELAMGAIALPDICVFNHEVIQQANLLQKDIDRIIAYESKELSRRNRLYRRNEPQPNLKDKVVILVDDGMATGATMRAAVNAVAQQQPFRMIVAIPVASTEALTLLKQHADDVVCLQEPTPFFGVGNFYEDFSQTTDEEVLTLLEKARQWGKGHVHCAGEHRHLDNGL